MFWVLLKNTLFWPDYQVNTVIENVINNDIIEEHFMSEPGYQT